MNKLCGHKGCAGRALAYVPVGADKRLLQCAKHLSIGDSVPLHQSVVTRAAVKAVGAADAGIISFYPAIFSNVDHVGDRVLPGAFTNWLAARRASGKLLPIVWSHQWDQAADIIGYADPADVVEDATGLLIKRGVLDIATNPTARATFDLIKRGIVTGASFAYDVIDERRGADGANELVTLDVIEAGPCLVGANALAGQFQAKAYDPADAALCAARESARLDAEALRLLDDANAIEQVELLELAAF